MFRTGTFVFTAVFVGLTKCCIHFCFIDRVCEADTTTVLGGMCSIEAFLPKHIGFFEFNKDLMTRKAVGINIELIGLIYPSLYYIFYYIYPSPYYIFYYIYPSPYYIIYYIYPSLYYTG